MDASLGIPHKSLLRLCSLLLALLHVSAASECQFVPPCKCKTSDYQIDLQPLMAARKDEPLSVPGGDYTYYIHPCNKVVTDQKCSSIEKKDFVACQVSNTNNAWPIGKVGGNAMYGEPEKDSVALTNSYIDQMSYNRTMQVSLICASVQGELQYIDSTSSGQGTVYSFKLTTTYACANPVSGGRISAGSVLTILFFVGVIVYLVGGVLFLKFVRKAEGKEVIPNYEFWIGFPGLVKDGVLFTCRGCKAESTYEKI